MCCLRGVINDNNNREGERKEEGKEGRVNGPPQILKHGCANDLYITCIPLSHTKFGMCSKTAIVYD